MSEVKEAEKKDEAEDQMAAEEKGQVTKSAEADAEKPKEETTKETPKEKEESHEEKPAFTVERDYVVNLRKVYWGRKANRSKRAVRLIKEFVARHMHTKELVLDGKVNEAVWSRGIEKPPRKMSIHVGITKEKRAYVYLKEDNGHSE
jgi:ribosomal protein L31E